MSTASVGIRASKPRGVPLPPGVPSNAEDLLTGDPAARWLWTGAGNTTFTVSPATYDGMNYNGGIEATKINPATAYLGFHLRSIGTWYQNRPAGTIFIYLKARRTSTPTNVGFFSVNASKGTSIFPLTNYEMPLGTSYYLITTNVYPVNTDYFTFFFNGLVTASTNLFAIVYIGGV